MDIELRDPTAADEPAWRALWANYCAFYREVVPEAVTAATWARIIAPDPAMHLRLALADGPAVGFALTVLHTSSWRVTPDAYLEDLFIAPQARGQGIARRLIDDLLARARAAGWSRVSWHTNADNAAARRLYDSYAPADGFIRYRLTTC